MTIYERGASTESFASQTYLQTKALWKGLPIRSLSSRRKKKAPTTFSDGRDPKPLGSVLDFATRDMGWTSELEQARVITDWADLVGETTAPHTRVNELRDGLLIIQCDSTAWATELRRMRAQILSRIIETYPDARIRDLRFLAPGAPTWRHGSRVAPGRGPRDTYG